MEPITNLQKKKNFSKEPQKIKSGFRRAKEANSFRKDYLKDRFTLIKELGRCF